MTLEEFCNVVTMSLHSSLVDTQNAKKAYDSDSLKAFADIRISHFQASLYSGRSPLCPEYKEA